jgi:hypothetical protein
MLAVPCVRDRVYFLMKKIFAAFLAHGKPTRGWHGMFFWKPSFGHVGNTHVIHGQMPKKKGGKKGGKGGKKSDAAESSNPFAQVQCV